MAFTQWTPPSSINFNSASSLEILDIYNNTLNDKLQKSLSRPKHKTFAGSQFRCDRLSWFRLRGTEPDSQKQPDTTLNFIADVGTACHIRLQTILKDGLGEDWISVEDHINELQTFPFKYEIQSDNNGLESFINIFDPPIRFACDGIVRIKETKYLLEIKTSEMSSWRDLTEPKPHHIDQVRLYASILDLDKILFIYQERQYGELKSFEISVSRAEKDKILSRMKYVKEMADAGVAPDGLPKGDSWCTPSMCPYYQKCKEYGR